MGVLVWGVLSGFFCLEGFVRGDFCPSLLLSEYICYNRKLNITFNFRFHKYEKNLKSVTSHALRPSPCHKLSHLLGPLPLERDVLYGRPPTMLQYSYTSSFMFEQHWLPVFTHLGASPLVPSGCMRTPLKSRPVCVSWWDARIGHYYCTHNRVLVSFLTPINSAHQDSVGLVKAQQTTTSDMIGRHPAIIIVY